MDPQKRRICQGTENAEEFYERVAGASEVSESTKMHLGEAYRHDLNLIFCREDGSPLPKLTFYNVFKSCLAKIDAPPLPIHSTRHTHAVMLLEAGADMKYVQERLGHQNYQITADVYSHVSKKMEERSIEKSDDYMSAFFKKIVQKLDK